MNTQEERTIPREESEKGQSPEPREHEITVIINGTPSRVKRGRYSYEQIFDLAFPGQSIPPGYELPITYSLPRQHHEGTLLPGDTLELMNRMVINVLPTIQS